MSSDPMLRQSNMESLRILAFVMIIMDHVSWSGVTLIHTSDPSWLFSVSLNIISRFGVDLFVLIGAYFMCSGSLSIRKIVKRWRAILYPVAVLVAVIYLISPPISMQQAIDDLIRMLQGNPFSIGDVWLGHLWFIYPYLILIAISPILNHAIKSMDRGTHKRAIIGLTGLFIVVPTINALTSMPLLYIAGGPILLFISLYFVAGYIRKYDVRIAPIKGVAITAATVVIVLAMTLLYTSVLHIPTPENPNGTNTYFFGDSLLPVFIGSISLFLTFRSIDLKNRLINLGGKFTYEAYLVHPLVWNMVALVLPISYSAPYDGVPGKIVVTIVLVSILSMMYAFSRYLMDRGIARAWKGIRPISASNVESPNQVKP